MEVGHGGVWKRGEGEGMVCTRMHVWWRGQSVERRQDGEL